MISIKSYLERLGRPDPGGAEKAGGADDRALDMAGDKPAEIDGGAGDRSPALLQALRTVLGGLPLESADRAKGRSVIDGLLNRLDGVLQSFEILEIADE